MSEIKTYEVDVREALRWKVRVEAANEDEAALLAQKLCRARVVEYAEGGATLVSRYLVMATAREVFLNGDEPLKPYRVTFNEYEAYEAIIQAGSPEQARARAEALLREVGPNSPFERTHNERDELCVEEVRHG